ncbi:YkgJ family cysteine cluster protein [Pseudoalteromonas sp. S4741]|uniref:YkgJ family cysteine cluster protein n=1 Tax=Pseudoalteromonas sp. S4741 TaxID=579563 RepID=UPI00110B13CC|nr:YkgJ family cysteine cluster protein [Pseudoalteromonas sp. S4741]TMO21894.1 zinc/iron-chelating domain-containing protein [Pseudoalteromonas sp. S4741]
MQNCNQCGKCCTEYGAADLDTNQDEIEMWALFNPKIFQYVKNDKLWFDPTTGEQLTQCPFLELAYRASPEEKDKYTCSIYHDRPQDCRHYPSLISEMINDDCAMLEPVDKQNHFKAQKKLDILMIDSRS